MYLVVILLVSLILGLLVIGRRNPFRSPSAAAWSLLLVASFTAASEIVSMAILGQAVLFFVALDLSVEGLANLTRTFTNTPRYLLDIVDDSWAVGILSAVVLGLEWFGLLQFTEVTHNLCMYLLIVSVVNLETIHVFNPKN